MKNKKMTQPTLDAKELEVMQMLYGIGSPASAEVGPLEPRLSESEVKAIEQQVLRKLRHLRLENLTQLRRAG